MPDFVLKENTTIPPPHGGPVQTLVWSDPQEEGQNSSNFVNSIFLEMDCVYAVVTQ